MMHAVTKLRPHDILWPYKSQRKAMDKTKRRGVENTKKWWREKENEEKKTERPRVGKLIERERKRPEKGHGQKKEKRG